MIKKNYTTNIKGSTKKIVKPENICVTILAAGIGSRIKSYEPRSLLKIKDKTLIEHQITTINSCFQEPEIICVVGYESQRVIKKVKDSVRFVENQLYNATNTSESLRLAVNNTNKKGVLFMHGDLLFNPETITLDYSNSFVVVDTQDRIEKKEAGLTIENGKASIFSYGLECKWCQIAYITGKELRIARQIFLKFEEQHKKLLSFEILNKIIAQGGSFNCHEPDGMRIIEIDKVRSST
jgi:choline kinase